MLANTDTIRKSRSRAFTRAGWLAPILVFASGGLLLVLILAAASAHVFAGNSDGATVALEGLSISNGHLTLHGWTMTLESFWSIDALFYAAAVRIVGLRPDLLQIVPAIIAAFVVGFGAWLSGWHQRRTAAIVAAACTVVMLGLPSPDFAYYFLQGPWHIGTALWCLIAFAGLASGRLGRGWIVAIVFLAAALLGDFMSLAMGIAPLLSAAVFAIARTKRLRGGLGVLAAIPASIALAIVIHLIATAFGAFAVVNRNLPISLGQIDWNVDHLPSLLSGLFGVTTLSIGVASGPVALRAVHLLGLAVALFGILSALVGLARNVFSRQPVEGDQVSWRLEDLLLSAFVTDLMLFVVVSPTPNPNYERYLTPAVIFATVLGARSVGRLGASLRGVGVKCALLVFAAVTVAFGLDLAGLLSKAAPASPADNLAAFLEQANLTNGLGDYWSASLVTVKSGGSVTVRPVTTASHGAALLRFDRQSSADWYSGQHFQFLVYDTARPYLDVGATSATKTFGTPTHTYVVGTYRVLVWSRPVTLSPVLPPQPNPLRIYWHL